MEKLLRGEMTEESMKELRRVRNNNPAVDKEGHERFGGH
jgi:hypothetical protein